MRVRYETRDTLNGPATEEREASPNDVYRALNEPGWHVSNRMYQWHPEHTVCFDYGVIHPDGKVELITFLGPKNELGQ